MDKDPVRIWCDENMDILYISLKPGPAVDSEEIAENVRVEYDEQGNLIGIEIGGISKILSQTIVNRLLQEIKKLKAA